MRAWFEDHRNSSFIDVHPELALEMGWRLQLSDLVRAPLRIVVMERALEPGEAPLSGTTIFGRPRISLSDDISTVVQHSTNAMRVRVKDTADHLFSAKAYNWLKIESWDTMIQLGDLLDTEISATHLEREQLPSWAQNLLAQCHRIIVSLVNYITNIADEAAKEVPVGSRQYEIDNDRLAYIPAGAKVTFCGNIISSFSREQVLMTPFFWQKLVNETESREQFLGQPIYSGDLLCKKLGEDMEDFNDRVNAAMSRGLLPRVAAWFPGGVSVDPIRFHVQLWKAVSKAQQDWCPSTHALEFALHRTTHLALGFTEDEFRFLPLWAGGLDDETGAVFEDMTVPDTDMGPCQPGPTFVTGKTIAPSTTADSDTTIIGLGQSVQAAQSGTDTGASGSKRTDSFVDVSAPVSDFDLDDFDMVYGDTVSLEEAMEDIGLCSDSSKDGDAEYASQSVDNEDIESMTAEPGDVAFDEDYMRSDDDWSDLPSSSAL